MKKKILYVILIFVATISINIVFSGKFEARTSYNSELEYEENEDGGITVYATSKSIQNIIIPSTIEGKNVGKTCRVHYKGTFNDGSQFDSSYDRGEPLEFVCGAGMMIQGYDAAVADMEVGQIIDIHLMPEEAYGMPNPDAIFTVEIAQLPGSEDLTVGQQVYLSNAMGQPFPVKVTAKDDTTITLDANHEMAGKELNFKIELVEVN